jgi:hypothetical protein
LTPRQHERQAVALGAELRHGGGALACEIADISIGGARVRIGGQPGVPPAVGAGVSLSVDPFGELAGTLVWMRGEFLGLRFAGDPEAIAELLAALATYSGA